MSRQGWNIRPPLIANVADRVDNQVGGGEGIYTPDEGELGLKSIERLFQPPNPLPKGHGNGYIYRIHVWVTHYYRYFFI